MFPLTRIPFFLGGVPTFDPQPCLATCANSEVHDHPNRAQVKPVDHATRAGHGIFEPVAIMALNFVVQSILNNDWSG